MAGWGGGEFDEGGEGGAQTNFGGGGGSATCTGSEEQYTATHLIYGENGRTVNYVLQEKWCWYDGYTCTAGCDECPRPNSYVILSASEYRYDGARDQKKSRRPPQS